MAKDAKSSTDDPKPDPAKAREAPKPVQIGGESLLDRLLPHIKKILVGAIVLAVLIGTIVMFRSCNRAKQERETTHLVTALAAGRGPSAKADQPPDPVKNPGFANEKARAQRVLDEADAQGVKLLPEVRGSLLIDAGKLDEAIAELGKCTEGVEVQHVTCRENLAIALEAKALANPDKAAQTRGLEEALTAFTKMQPLDDGPRRVFAVYHQGRLQIVLGKKAEAKVLLEKAKTLKPPADLAEAIDRRLAELGTGA
jgi:hypothetical protein